MDLRHTFYCNFTLGYSKHVLSLKKWGNNSVLAHETLNFEFPIDVL